MSLALQEILSALTKSKIELIINNNRSTMIRVLERRRKYAKVTVHQMFLDAPNDVIEALVLLLKNKRNRDSSRLIHKFIEKSSPRYDDEKKSLNVSKLVSKGEAHDLSELYDCVNEQYFSSKLNLHITWFGTKTRIPRRQMTYGLYHQSLKLVKINWLLDTPATPRYFIEYIIYHEMLHEIYRPIIRANGYRSIHTKEFKEKEKLFLEFQQAKAYEKQFRKVIFK